GQFRHYSGISPVRHRQTQLASRGTTRHRRVMWSWRILGLISFAFGAIGLFLPIWPTTVFWIVAALAFARSNPAWAEWIYARPKIGPPIRTFVETGALSHAGKAAALGGMGLSAAVIGFAFWKRPVPLSIALSILGFGALFVMTRPRAPSDS
ncbi:YbaN family protein, partial [Hyphomonas sp.]